MTDWLLFKALQHCLPPDFMNLLVILLSAWVAIENWLASTKRIKANSTLEVTANLAKYIIEKAKSKKEN